MLIAIEGIDGCGKGTQTGLLVDRAASQGRLFASFSFPRYGANAFSAGIARYLNGEFGDLHSVPAEFAALLYAGDRLATRDELLEACDTADAVICDRYVPSNMAHQAAKLPADRRDAFLAWLTDIEYGIHRMPRPDCVIYLRLPVEMAAQLVAKKARRSYTDLAADIHESDVGYLQSCREVYDKLAAGDGASPWLTIDCLDATGHLLSAETIAAEIWRRLAADVPDFGQGA
ncbi:MAG: hypothetical protein RIC55_21155 [Pirellulaceae bacterium]